MTFAQWSYSTYMCHVYTVHSQMLVCYPRQERDAESKAVKWACGSKSWVTVPNCALLISMYSKPQPCIWYSGERWWWCCGRKQHMGMLVESKLQEVVSSPSPSGHLYFRDGDSLHRDLALITQRGAVCKGQLHWLSEERRSCHLLCQAWWYLYNSL